jgi:hypothetical protein
MRRLGACLLLLGVLAGCATPDRHRVDAVTASEPSPVVGLLAQLLYLLGTWLGPKT